MNDTSAQFRSANSHDVELVIEFISAAGLPTDGVLEMFAQDPSQFLIATMSSEIVAVAGLEICCDNALLRSVAVRDDWRRRGLGQDLVKRVVCEAESRGIQALYLLTLTAEHYFPRFGFGIVTRNSVPEAIAATLEFKSACPASAVVMAKQLVG